MWKPVAVWRKQEVIQVRVESVKQSESVVVPEIVAFPEGTQVRDTTIYEKMIEKRKHRKRFGYLLE